MNHRSIVHRRRIYAQCIRMRKAITGFAVLRQWMPFGYFEICNGSSSSSHQHRRHCPIHASVVQNVSNLYGYCMIFSWNKSNNENSCCMRFTIKSVRTRTRTHLKAWVCSTLLARNTIYTEERSRHPQNWIFLMSLFHTWIWHTIQNARHPYPCKFIFHAWLTLCA